MSRKLCSRPHRESKLHKGICHVGYHTLRLHTKSRYGISISQFPAIRITATVVSARQFAELRTEHVRHMMCSRAGPRGLQPFHAIPAGEHLDNNSNLTPTQRIQVCGVISSSLIGDVEGSDPPYQLPGRSFKLPRELVVGQPILPMCMYPFALIIASMV